jgi:antitoxin (DNA-binding transcriptional repressor) of toxin-antitoxin stability system
MSNIVSVTDFRNNIADVLNRVKYRQETIYLIRGKTLVAKISKVDDYLPARVKSRKQENVAVGFFPAVKVIATRELGELREFGGKMGKQIAKKTLEGATILHFKFKRWVKFCASFQKSWG